MQYSRLGETGLVVSRLAFGSMTFGSAESDVRVGVQGRSGRRGRAGRARSRCWHQLLQHRRRVCGWRVRANAGQGDRGQTQGGRDRDQVGNRMGPSLVESGLSRRHILAAAEGSLTRLGTDYIGVYLVHKVDTITPVEETIEALEDMPLCMDAGVGVMVWSPLAGGFKAIDITLDADEPAQLDAATTTAIPYPQWFNPRVADGQVYAALGLPLATRRCVD